MRRRGIALGLAATLTFVGCTAESGGGETGSTDPTDNEQKTEITVRNILGVKIDMGSEVGTYNPAMKRGEIAAGATAIATCIAVNEGNLDYSDVFVRNTNGDEGFISIFAASGKEEKPLQQITPGYEELKHLPPCGDTPTDA